MVDENEWEELSKLLQDDVASIKKYRKNMVFHCKMQIRN